VKRWLTFSRTGSVLILALLSSPQTAWAEGFNYSLTSAAFKMVGVLALVLSLLIGLVYLLRRFSPSAGRLGWVSQDMTLLGQYPLGPKKLLAMVKVGDEVLLLGVTEASINLLTRIEDPELLERLKTSRAASPSSFAQVLKRLGQRPGKESSK